MRHSAAGGSDDVIADVLEEFAILSCVDSCESDTVADIVGRAIRDFRSAEGDEGALIAGAMLGVVRGTLGTRMDAREAARGAILGILRVHDVLGYSVAAVFAEAAPALILKTAALQGRFDATIRGVLDAALNDGGLGLDRQQVMSVVALAMLDATMESMQLPMKEGRASIRSCPLPEGGARRAEHDQDVSV